MGEFLLKLLELSLWAGILTIVVLGIRLADRSGASVYVWRYQLCESKAYGEECHTVQR